ncbi:MAG: metal ABC transporter ATP-binding protein [Candidatus Thermoplasmatota archaeon]|nr:metal ABC transporter ATP-binding protein [Candidatus Thermoplasmatota archaeon]
MEVIPGDRMESSKLEMKLSKNPVLKISELSVSRAGNTVLRDINLSVHDGEFVGIVGPNGSGKTTLLLTVLGILKPNSGNIQTYGKPPLSIELFDKISFVPQTASNLPNRIQITVRELVELGTVKLSNLFFDSDKQGRRKLVDNAIKIVGLEHLENMNVGKLSGGERQRAVIARALASKAELILFDEPLVGIDNKTRNELLKLLDDLCHNENKTIIMVSHDLTAIRQTAHRMIYLEEEIRFDGSPRDFPNLEELARLRGIVDAHEGHQVKNHILTKEFFASIKILEEE